MNAFATAWIISCNEILFLPFKAVYLKFSPLQQSKFATDRPKPFHYYVDYSIDYSFIFLHQIGEIPFIKDISNLSNFILWYRWVMNSVSYCAHWPLFGSWIFLWHTFRLFNVDEIVEGWTVWANAALTTFLNSFFLEILRMDTAKNLGRRTDTFPLLYRWHY